jgi:hypothetical protein
MSDETANKAPIEDNSELPQQADDTEEVVIAKKEEKEIDSVTDYKEEKESDASKLQNSLSTIVGATLTNETR